MTDYQLSFDKIKSFDLQRRWYFNNEDKIHFENIQELVNKSKPLKVIDNRCPTCNSPVNILWNKESCGECRQALDWGIKDVSTIQTN